MNSVLDAGATPSATETTRRDFLKVMGVGAGLAGLAPQAEPPAGGRANFLALVLCLMLGTAAMPHILTRYYTTPSVSETRRSVGWSLFFIVLLYVSAPALAVMVNVTSPTAPSVASMASSSMPGQASSRGAGSGGVGSAIAWAGSAAASNAAPCAELAAWAASARAFNRG